MKIDIKKLSQSIQEKCPEIVFAFIHGSAKEGIVNPGSDVDIAVYIDGKISFDIITKVYDAVMDVIKNAEPDIGILNNADPIYRFEALNGSLLLSRDKEKYLDFFVRTCKEYEMQIADYERQKKYRLEAQQTINNYNL